MQIGQIWCIFESWMPVLLFIGIYRYLVTEIIALHGLRVVLPVALLRLPGVSPPRPVIFLWTGALEDNQGQVIRSRSFINKIRNCPIYSLKQGLCINYMLRVAVNCLKDGFK